MLWQEFMMVTRILGSIGATSATTSHSSSFWLPSAFPSHSSLISSFPILIILLPAWSQNPCVPMHCIAMTIDHLQDHDLILTENIGELLFLGSPFYNTVIVITEILGGREKGECTRSSQLQGNWASVRDRHIIDFHSVLWYIPQTLSSPPSASSSTPSTPFTFSSPCIAWHHPS